MSTVYGFNSQNDVDRLLHMLADYKGNQSHSQVTPSSIRQEARYAKIKTLVNNSGDTKHDGKEATGVQVVWDKTKFDFSEVNNNPVIYDNDQLKSSSATVFNRNNITSKTAMSVGDVVLLQQYPHLSDTSSWLVVETGGSTSNHGLCTITGEGANDKQYLVSIILGNPNEPTGEPPKTGILHLNYATTNPISVGAQIMTIVYKSSTGDTYDCYPVETLYNLVVAP